VSRILVIEDNEDLAFGLRNNLEIEGHTVDVAADGTAGLERTRSLAPDLVILDLMLPGTDGFRVLRALRADGLSMPVLILTARGEEADKVRGLRLGADDYVTKPFGLLELLARVEALLRRASPRQASGAAGGRIGIEGPVVVRFGDIEVNRATRSVTRRGEPVDLSPKEFDLLIALLGRDGAVAPRLALLREVWGYADDVATRTLDTHIAELRRKLEDDPSQPRHILTARKAGYRLQKSFLTES
jgi:DNA-binding response OmpR family regulator